MAKRAPFQFSLRWLLMVVTAAAVLFAVITVVAPDIRESPRRSACQSNLRQIAQAMHLYHDFWGSLPPAYVADATGKPMHSWRVLLLPFLGEGALYDRYDFSEPWDGANNRKLAASMPAIYQCPKDRKNAETTSYVVVVGAETPFNADQAMTLQQIAGGNGTPWTILVAECVDSNIHWMQPRDLELAQMSLQINDRTSGKIGLRSRHAGGANVVMYDTATLFLTEDVGRPNIEYGDPKHEGDLRVFLTATAGDDVAGF